MGKYIIFNDGINQYVNIIVYGIVMCHEMMTSTQSYTQVYRINKDDEKLCPENDQMWGFK